MYTQSPCQPYRAQARSAQSKTEADVVRKQLRGASSYEDGARTVSAGRGGKKISKLQKQLGGVHTQLGAARTELDELLVEPAPGDKTTARIAQLRPQIADLETARDALLGTIARIEDKALKKGGSAGLSAQLTANAEHLQNTIESKEATADLLEQAEEPDDEAIDKLWDEISDLEDIRDDVLDRGGRVDEGGDATLELEITFNRNARVLAQLNRKLLYLEGRSENDDLPDSELNAIDVQIDQVDTDIERLEDEQDFLAERIDTVIETGGGADPKKLKKMERQIDKQEAKRDGFEAALEVKLDDLAALDAQIVAFYEADKGDKVVERVEKRYDVLEVGIEKDFERVEEVDDRIGVIRERILGTEFSGDISAQILRLDQRIGNIRQRILTKEGNVDRLDVISDYKEGFGDGIDNWIDRIDENIDRLDDRIGKFEDRIIDLETA